MKFRLQGPEVNKIYYVEFKDPFGPSSYSGKVKVIEVNCNYGQYKGREWTRCLLLDKYTSPSGFSVGYGTYITQYYINRKSFKGER